MVSFSSPHASTKIPVVSDESILNMWCTHIRTNASLDENKEKQGLTQKEDVLGESCALTAPYYRRKG